MPPTYKLLYNIGKIAMVLDDPATALAAFERYLEEGKDDIPAKRRKEVETLLASVRPNVGRVDIHVSEPGASIRLDGFEIGDAPASGPLILKAGRHSMKVAKKGYRPVATTIEVPSEALLSVPIHLEPLPRGASDTRDVGQALPTPTVRPSARGCACELAARSEPVDETIAIVAIVCAGATARRRSRRPGRDPMPATQPPARAIARAPGPRGSGRVRGRL
jgi:hypothetical protein